MGKILQIGPEKRKPGNPFFTDFPLNIHLKNIENHIRKMEMGQTFFGRPHF